MAILRPVGGRENYVLSLAPVWPTIAGPHDAYDLSLEIDGKTVYSRRQSGTEWLSGYWVIESLARTFKYAGQLIDQKARFSLGDDVDLGHPFKPLFGHADIYWFEAVLNGVKTARGIEDIILSCFLRVDPDPETGIERFIAARFHCSRAECEQFGATLKEECDAAEARRKELGFVSED